MANRTVKDAKSIKGTNPQYLIEKIIRSRIYDCKYWKEECFALTAELLVDKAMELRYVGGVYGGNVKPCPFLCLTLKMLQIQPEKDIIVEFIKNQDYKYVRALGAYYMRLTGTSLDCYNYLEPLYNDYRKLRRQNREGSYELVFMDEFMDELLREERVCDVILPRLQKRQILEENNEIQPRMSLLDDSDEEMEQDESGGDEEEESRAKGSQLEQKKGRGDDRDSRHDRERRHRRKSTSSSSTSSNSSPERHRDRRRGRGDHDRRSSRDRKEARDRRRDSTPDRERRRQRAREGSRRDREERSRGDRERDRPRSSRH